MATMSPEQLVQQNTGGPDILKGFNTKPVTNSRIYKGTYRQAQAYQDILPSLMATFYKSLNQQAPTQAQTQLDLLKNLGPQFAQQEAAINKIGQESKAQTDLGLLRGVGKDITTAQLDLAKLADPEFFGLRQKLGDKAGALLDAQDPTQLSGSELATIERGVNRNNVRRGVSDSGSTINTVRSGMLFGDALAAKQSRLGQTLNSIASFAPNLRSGAFNPAMATGQSGSGTGMGEFSSASNSGTQLGANFASNVLGQSGAGGQTVAGKTRDNTKDYERIMGSLPDY